MSGSAVIGALRVVFDADNDNFNAALDQSRSKIAVLETAVDQLTDKLRDAGVKIAAVGAGLTAALTVPLAALARSSVQTAGQFEAAMKRVESALDSVSGDQLKALEAQARTMGPTVGRGATEAAGAIENLAKNGLDASNILGGALAASLKLAAAGQAELAPAADLTTDIMHQFGKAAADLGPVVDKVSGALLASKFGFQDYQLAVGQAGGVAGAVGVSFEDFNTALAGTSALFQSGSDAGTSFKTFLTNLTGNSKQAKTEMTALGMSFYDSSHHLKGMADVAEVLRTTLGGLSDEARTKVLTDIFGTDGMRTAIGLMKLGKDGFVDLQQTISKASADKQVAKGQEGYVAAMARLAAAFENLKIAIGQSGLLNIFTSIANGLTRIVNAMASLSPFFMKIGAGFAAVSAAAGPLLIVLGGALYFAVGVFLRTLGPLGWAISALIEPIGTLVAAGIRLVAWAGTSMILRGVAGVFLDLAGPVGIAIAAFVAFKDYVIPALEQVWQAIVTRLGPPLEAIFAKVEQIFAKIANGPIGEVIGWLVKIAGMLVDVLGTTLGGLLEVAGELFVRFLGAATAALGAVVKVVGDVVDAISALLSGDFSGAWAAVEKIVIDVLDGIVNALVAIVPDMEAPLRGFYAAAKTWLADGFSAIGGWLSSAVAAMVNYVASAFPNIVAAAQGVYEGVKGWLVDKFSTLLGWIGTAAKWIGDRFAEMKKNLGFGGAGEVPAAPAVPAPAPAPKPKPVAANPYMPTTAGGGDKEKKGRDTKYDEDNRAELALQAELQAARARGDRETEQRLQDQLDLTKQIEAYQKTGLSLTDARARAERDMRDLQAARAQQAGREIADQQRAVNVEVAKLDKNVLLEDSLTRQAELQKRIDFYYQRTNNLIEARRLAEADQAKEDAARDRVRERWFADDADQRALRLAQLRGDTDAEIRQLQRVIDVKKRAADLEGQDVAPDQAKKQANDEADATEQARVQSVFRDTIKGGFKAALDGDFKSWFKNWLSDASQKAWEKALNSLSDLIASLFSKLASSVSSGGGGGGIFGTIAKALGSAIGGGINPSSLSSPGLNLGGAIPTTLATPSIDFGALPQFATGGSFKVGGMSGIDRNVVAFRASMGEMVDIKRPGNDTGPAGSSVVHQTINVSGGVDFATRSEVVRLAEATKRSTMDALDQRSRRRG